MARSIYYPSPPSWSKTLSYRVFINYCVFCLSLFSLGVSVCTPNRQRCSRTGNKRSAAELLCTNWTFLSYSIFSVSSIISHIYWTLQRKLYGNQCKWLDRAIFSERPVACWMFISPPQNTCLLPLICPGSQVPIINPKRETKKTDVHMWRTTTNW